MGEILALARLRGHAMVPLRELGIGREVDYEVRVVCVYVWGRG